MKVAFLTRYDERRGSSRLRAFDLVPHLARRSVEARVLPRRGSRAAYAARALALAAWADVVVLQKPSQGPRLLDLLRGVNRRLAVDLDDALWSAPGHHPAAHREAGARRAKARLDHALGAARAAFTGSEHLADWVRARHPGLDVLVLPTSVDLDRWSAAPSESRTGTSDRPLTLGWIGSGGNLGELERLAPELRRLAASIPVKLRVISDRTPEIPGVELDSRPWSTETEAADLASCDLGLMPLDDTERGRGRCGFKAIQYMAAGLPVIASAIGAAGEVVEDGVTGLLVPAGTVWDEALGRLAADPALRLAMGRAGRRRVERSYSVEVNLPRMVAALERLRGERRREPA